MSSFMEREQPRSLVTSKLGEPSSSNWRDWLGRLLIAPKVAPGGVHIDPVGREAPDPRHWPSDVQAAWFSREMDLFRGCLQVENLGEQESVLDDLSKFYGLATDECRRRCLHWEDLSLEEWRAGDRTTGEGLTDFYESIHSWNFDLLWYANLQASGFAFPASVLAARFAQQHCAGRDHLDFGSGVGATSQLFGRLGFSSTLADVSKPLLEFARWRLQRHGDGAKFLDLKTTPLPSAAYDIVTAIDALILVPDFDGAVIDILLALKPGVWMLADFVVREMAPDKNTYNLFEINL